MEKLKNKMHWDVNDEKVGAIIWFMDEVLHKLNGRPGEHIFFRDDLIDVVKEIFLMHDIWWEEESRRVIANRIIQEPSLAEKVASLNGISPFKNE